MAAVKLLKGDKERHHLVENIIKLASQKIISLIVTRNMIDSCCLYSIMLFCFSRAIDKEFILKI